MSNATRQIQTKCSICDTRIILIQVWGITDNQEGSLNRWTPGDEHLACPVCVRWKAATADKADKEESPKEQVKEDE